MLNAIPQSRRWLLALTLVLGTALMLSAAPVEEKPEAKGPETAAEKVRKELDKVTTLELADQPLNLAINQLREQTKINIVLDQFMLNQMGLQPEAMQVTCNEKNQKVRSILRSVIRPYGLSFAVIEDTVLISTNEACTQRLMRQNVTVDFEKVELATALKKMARQTGTNVVFDPKVGKEITTPVTMQLDQEMPYELAVKLMVEMAGLKAVRIANVLFICTKEKANEMRADPDFAPNPNGPNGPFPPGIDFPPGAIPRVFQAVPGGIGMGGGAVPVPAPGVIPVDPLVPEKPGAAPAQPNQPPVPPAPDR